MRHYETTFIIEPVLSGDEIDKTARSYVDLLEKAGCEIVHVNRLGLRQLAYPINNRSTGIYFSIEFASPTGEIIDTLELAFRRDERVMRFLSVKLNKFGVKFNEDKRNGLIGKVKPKPKPVAQKNRGRRGRRY